jgi:hypothetical protein
MPHLSTPILQKKPAANHLFHGVVQGFPVAGSLRVVTGPAEGVCGERVSGSRQMGIATTTNIQASISHQCPIYGGMNHFKASAYENHISTKIAIK